MWVLVTTWQAVAIHRASYQTSRLIFVAFVAIPQPVWQLFLMQFIARLCVCGHTCHKLPDSTTCIFVATQDVGFGCNLACGGHTQSKLPDFTTDFCGICGYSATCLATVFDAVYCKAVCLWPYMPQVARLDNVHFCCNSRCGFWLQLGKWGHFCCNSRCGFWLQLGKW